MFQELVFDKTTLQDAGGTEWRICCPSCGDRKYHLYISKERHTWICHRCDARGNEAKLISLLYGVKYREAQSMLQTNLEIVDPIDDSLASGYYSILRKIMNVETEEITVTVTSKTIKMPRWAEKINRRDNEFQKYWQRRGFKPEQFAEYHVRKFVSGNDKFLFIPFFENNQLVYWQCRSISDDRKIFPSDSEALGKSYYLYNYDKAKEYRDVVIVEGWADAITVGPCAVSVQGKIVSQTQLEKLADMEAENYYFFFDPNDDTVGHMIKAANALKDRLNGHQHVFLVMPKSSKDPNEMGTTACWEAIDNFSVPVESTDAVLAKIS